MQMHDQFYLYYENRSINMFWTSKSLSSHSQQIDIKQRPSLHKTPTFRYSKMVEYISETFAWCRFSQRLFVIANHITQFNWIGCCWRSFNIFKHQFKSMHILKHHTKHCFYLSSQKKDYQNAYFPPLRSVIQ